MRWRFLILALLSMSSGCTHLALERRTINQASTTSDLQYRQVLDNLAMFACNREALPWHLKLQSASIQVTDFGSGQNTDGFSGAASPFTLAFAWQANASRGVVNQWGGVPTVDPDTLDLLALAYRRALDPQFHDASLRPALYRKMAELAVLYNLVLTKETLDKIIDNTPMEETKAWQLKRRNADLQEHLEKAFDQIAKLSRPITDVQVDNYAQRLSNKVTEETRGEARARLQVQQAQASAQVSQTRIGVEDEIVRMTRELAPLPYVPRYPVTGRQERNSRDITLAQTKIRVLYDLAEMPQFNEPWVSITHHKKILHNCGGYTGRYTRQGCHCCVHVAPEHLATLRNFTLAILALSPIETQETPSGVTTGNVTYSPLINR